MTRVRCEGDVRDRESLRPLFEGGGESPLYLIHTAGLIDIGKEVSPALYAVNVEGTKNLLALCAEYQVERMVYVSSVHAIPEGGERTVLREINCFSAEQVVGGYAKTKAEATEAVLDAARAGLSAVVVQPSGILGPYDTSGNHLVQMVGDYLRGKLPACVRGGYDFVDVRDVAAGCLSALTRGRAGECYILSNRRYELREVLGMVRRCWAWCAGLRAEKNCLCFRSRSRGWRHLPSSGGRGAGASARSTPAIRSTPSALGTGSPTRRRRVSSDIIRVISF